MQANKIAELMKWQLISSLREAIKEGLDVAMYHTVQDSSNAAYHWQVGLSPRLSVPAATKLGRSMGDYRGQSPVGVRGAGGSHRNSVRAAVIQREIDGVVNTKVKGNHPPTAIYLYNIVGDMTGDPGNGLPYSVNANIQAAGTAAINAMISRFHENYKQGKVLKRRRK